MAEIQKLDLMKMIEEPGLSLREGPGQLYRLLKEGPAKDVISKMVFRVIGSLDNRSNEEMEQLIDEVARIGNKIIRRVEDSFGEMRRLWEDMQKVKQEKDAVSAIKEIRRIQESLDSFRFSKDICHKDNIKVLSFKEIVNKSNSRNI